MNCSQCRELTSCVIGTGLRVTVLNHLSFSNPLTYMCRIKLQTKYPKHKSDRSRINKLLGNFYFFGGSHCMTDMAISGTSFQKLIVIMICWWCGDNYLLIYIIKKEIEELTLQSHLGYQSLLHTLACGQSLT